MNMENLEPHELSKLFPPMTKDEFRGLARDIKKHGLINEIVLLEGQILEGAHRYKACKLAGIEPRYRKFNGKDGSPVDFVMSQNLHRRHLTKSQRAAIAAELANMKRTDTLKKGSRSIKVSNGNSAEQAAKQLKVGVAYVQRAKRLKRETPEVFDAVKAGKITVSKAMQPIMPSKRKQGKTAVSAGSGRKGRTRIAPIASEGGAPLSQHPAKTDLWYPERFKRRDKQMAKRYRVALQLNEFSRTVDGVDWTKAPAIAKRAYEQGFIDGITDTERGLI
jgi:hypothetical protein